MISISSGTTFVATLPSGANGPIEQLADWYGDLMVFTKAMDSMTESAYNSPDGKT